MASEWKVVMGDNNWIEEHLNKGWHCEKISVGYDHGTVDANAMVIVAVLSRPKKHVVSHTPITEVGRRPEVGQRYPL